MTTVDMAQTPEMQALKGDLKAVSESGDYGVFARHLEAGALVFPRELNLNPGEGSGRLTVMVVASD